jgi:ubiquinone/menaquinone biosynthesis C-methylase UbiE
VPQEPFNYDRVSSFYDRHRAGAGPYFDALIAHAHAVDATRVLEFGAGTGNETVAFLQAQPCHLTALERSRGMLAQGRAKGLQATWVQGDATAMPLRDGAFDFVFSCYVIHHIRDLDTLCRECRRVLHGGCAAFITVPEGFIANHPLNPYFPSIPKIDLARFQPMTVVMEAMRAAGFQNVGENHCIAAPRTIDAEYANRIAGKFISTYDLIPTDEHAEGVARLRADIAAGKAPIIAREASVIYGYV